MAEHKNGEPVDIWAIACNITGCKIFSPGTRVWLCQIPGDWAYVEVFGRSRGGRNVKKWVAFTRLSNFRKKWLPHHLRLGSVPLNEKPEWANNLLHRIKRIQTHCHHNGRGRLRERGDRNLRGDDDGKHR